MLVCFLHIHVIGTNVLGPTKQMYPPVVDLLSRKSEAKLASEKTMIRQSSGGSPTKHTKNNQIAENERVASLLLY